MAKKRKKDEAENLDAFLNDTLGPSGLHDVPMYLPSGSFMLDLAMGQGYPCGHITEMYGPEGSGKTLFLLLACREIILRGGTAVYIDVESRLHKSLVQKYIGIDPESPGFRYHYCQKSGAPWTLEALFNFLDASVMKHNDQTPLLIGVDTIAMLRSEDQDEDMHEKRQMGLPANRWSRWITNGIISKMRGRPIFIVFLNQIRTEVNFFKMGPPQDISQAGGKALRHAVSTKLEFSSQAFGTHQVIKNRKFDKDAGKNIVVHVEKNTVSPPNRSAVVPFFFYPLYGHQGIDDAMSMLAYLTAHEKVKYTGHQGNWEFGGHKAPWLSLRDLIRDNDEVRNLAQQKVVEAYRFQYNLE